MIIYELISITNVLFSSSFPLTDRPACPPAHPPARSHANSVYRKHLSFVQVNQRTSARMLIRWSGERCRLILTYQFTWLRGVILTIFELRSHLYVMHAIRRLVSFSLLIWLGFRSEENIRLVPRLICKY